MIGAMMLVSLFWAVLLGVAIMAIIGIVVSFVHGDWFAGIMVLLGIWVVVAMVLMFFGI
jgi:hypothetical protein